MSGADRELSELVGFRAKRRTLGALLGVGLVEACRRIPVALAEPTPAPEDLAAKHGLVLASGVQVVLDLPSQAVTVVLLEGEQLFVDGAPAGTIAVLRKASRSEPLRDLHRVMVSQRGAWIRANPDRAWPGVALFWLDAKTSGVVVKSLLQAAALAGAPNIAFVVRAKSDPKRIARINVDVRLPDKVGSNAPRADEPELHVEAAFDKALVATWKRGEEIVETVPLTERVERGKLAYPGLAAAVTRSWAARGKYKTAADRRFDRAMIHPANELPLQTLLALVDAIYAPERDFGYQNKVERVPAFDIAVEVWSR